MADYGMKIYDENGDLIFHTDYLSHRVWHVAVYTAAGNYSYGQPLDHEPTVVALAVAGNWARKWTHITSGGQYTGITLHDSSAATNATLIIVFARK